MEKSREDLANGERRIEAFLTHMAVDEQVASTTQNQAMNALVFLYKRVLQLLLNETINAVRADRKVNVNNQGLILYSLLIDPDYAPGGR